MKKKIKRIICLFMLSFISLFISCSSKDANTKDNLNAVSFNYYKNVLISNNNYLEIYQINNTNDALYKLKKYEKPNSINWTLNYIYEYSYIYNEGISNEVFDLLYDNLEDSISLFENEINLDLNFEKDGFKEEREINITLKENEEIYLVDLFIPYKIVYHKDEKVYNSIISIPVYTFLASLIDNELKFNSNTYDFNSFINGSNIIK